jgi:hypothetical protein
MSRWYVLDADGNPVHEPDMLTAARWFETADRTVAKTKVSESEVSTVFLSLDHSHGEGPPLIYETMVFGGPLDQEQDRYPTRDAALAGHDQMVARVRDAATG